MSATLTPEQNKRLRDAAQRLVDLHKGNISAAARAIGRDQSFLNRLLKEKAGGSFAMASLIARELGERVTDLLALPSDEQITLWQDLPGFDEALENAKSIAGSRYSPTVWASVAGFAMPWKPPYVEPWMLMNIASLIESLNVKQLTGSSKPPHDDGVGHRTSQRRIKKPKPR